MSTDRETDRQTDRQQFGFYQLRKRAGKKEKIKGIPTRHSTKKEFTPLHLRFPLIDKRLPCVCGEYIRPAVCEQRQWISTVEHRLGLQNRLPPRPDRGLQLRPRAGSRSASPSASASARAVKPSESAVEAGAIGRHGRAPRAPQDLWGL